MMMMMKRYRIMKGRGLDTVVAAVAVLVLAAATPIAIRSETGDHRCGPCFGCESCDGARCCSINGYCGDDHDHCGDGVCMMNCHYQTPACEPDDNYCDYSNDNYHRDGSWESRAAGGAARSSVAAACTSSSANISMDGRVITVEQGQSPPPPFCENHGGGSQPNNVTSYRAACGNCLKVTNRKTGKQIKVRLPASEECSNNQLFYLGKRILQGLYTDGEGRGGQVYLAVDYQVVQCDDGN